MPLTTNKTFWVDVDNEKRRAYLAVHGDMPEAVVTYDEIVADVKALGIVLNSLGCKNIKAFVDSLNEGAQPGKVLIAQCIEPVNDQKGRLVKCYPEPEVPIKKPVAKADEVEVHEGVDTQSHYERSDIITVSKGDKLFHILPPVDGEDGEDVYGGSIPRKLGAEARFDLGINVAHDGDLIMAIDSGQLIYENDKIRINTVLKISGDVDFGVGNVNFIKDVSVVRNILDLFKVKCGGTLEVGGLIEAADVETGADLVVVGGITGKEKGTFNIGNDIRSKYITNATVLAKNDITVGIEVVNSSVNCGGRLTISNGKLVGGHTYAMGGITVKNLGSEGEILTRVEVAIDESLKSKYDEYLPKINLNNHKIKKIKQVVEPLLANQKQLNAEQKGKATELLFQTYELDDEVNVMVTELRNLYNNIQARGVEEIIVTGTLYPKVALFFPRVEAKNIKCISGPIKIYPKKVGQNQRVVAEHMSTGDTTDLGAVAGVDEFWGKLEKLIQEDEPKAK